MKETETDTKTVQNKVKVSMVYNVWYVHNNKLLLIS